MVPTTPAMMSRFSNSDGAAEQAALMVEASRLMKQGLGLVAGDPGSEALAHGLDCFDRALALRRLLPVDDVAVLRYDLAACWLNRAETLVRVGDRSSVALAVDAYDEAIALLSTLTLADDARFARRLAIAHQNRGLVLQALDRPSHVIVWAFLDAIAVLEHPDAAPVEDRARLLGAATVNLARTLLGESTPHAGVLARQAVLRGLAFVEGLEADDVEAAIVGLTGRHLLCQIIAAAGLPDPADSGAAPDAVHEATDCVDEGLALIRLWEQRGTSRFRDIARDLYGFGVRVYAVHQPQFLREFIEEQSGPATCSPDYVESAEMRAAAERLFQPAGPPRS